MLSPWPSCNENRANILTDLQHHLTPETELFLSIYDNVSEDRNFLSNRNISFPFPLTFFLSPFILFLSFFISFFLFLFFSFWAAAPKGTKSCRTQGDFRSSVRSFVRPFVRSSVCPDFFSKTGHRIFLIFCMKLDIDKGKRVTKPDFGGKIAKMQIWQKCGLGGSKNVISPCLF